MCYFGRTMAVFVSVTTDAFAEQFAKKRERVPQVNVRRPLRGIQVKPNTYAVLRVLTASGRDIPLFDSSSNTVDSNGIGSSTYYSNYLVQQITEQRVEKQQIIETFGEDYVFFFGESPRFLNVSGMLLNTADFNWKSEFWANYETTLRGTRLVEQNARIYFYFDDVVVEGYILSAGTGASAESPHALSFNFQLFISNYAILSSVGSVFLPDSLSSQPRALSLEPFTLDERRENAARAAQIGSPGGLAGFLAAASQFATNADFAIQETLETIKTFFYGKRIAVPDGLDSQIAIEPVTNQAAFDAAPTGRPIHEMSDEYVERAAQGTNYDQFELARVNALMSIQDPVTLDLKARSDLAAHGVNISKPSEVMILLGRGAFAALQYTAPFALGRTGGFLGQVDQGMSTIL